MFLILMIGMIFVSSCAKEKKISFTLENLNGKQLIPGIYYEYEYSDEEIKDLKDINAELILKNLIANNIPIEEAWHKEFRASCCPPGTNRCMQAIVEPVFLIKLERETKLENFVKVEPDIEWCAYYVKYYKIK